MGRKVIHLTPEAKAEAKKRDKARFVEKNRQKVLDYHRNYYETVIKPRKHLAVQAVDPVLDQLPAEFVLERDNAHEQVIQ